MAGPIGDERETHWYAGLDGPARDFAASEERVLRALAGPGTGKTFALIRRVARLLEEGVPPERILVLTFARTAAQDLVGALRRLGDVGYEAVKAQTLHAYCFSLLWREGVLQATGRVPRIVMNFERDMLLTDLRGPFGTLRDRRKLAIAFESAWARRQTDEPGQPVGGLDQDFQDALLGTLRWHKAMLIGELVPVALNCLQHNPQSPELHAYDHALVDEYQDLNRAEQELIDLLSEHGNLAVIGDDDQSIYSFKWANPEGIRTFDATHAGTVDVLLEECRRCPTSVVELARTLVERDTARLGRRLVPFPGNPVGEVHNVQWRSLQAEADGVAAFIKARIDAGTDPGQCLVLTSSRTIGQLIRDALVARDVPADSYFREEPVDAAEAREALTLLTLLIDPSDRVALRAWLGFGGSNFRTASYVRSLRVAQESNTDVAGILADVAAGRLTVPYSTPFMDRWHLLERRRVELAPLLDDLRALIDVTLPDGEAAVALLRQTAEAAIDVDENEDEVEPDAFLTQLRSSISQPEVPIESAEARIMSFHKSKGLTADVVVMAGLLEGLMPWSADDRLTVAEHAAALAEQRRLFYVGMTRTRRALVFSSASEIPAYMTQRYRIRHRGWGMNGYRTIASGFMGELGPTLPRAIRGDRWEY